MATCDSWRLRVILHLDDELDAGERRLVESHLKTCAACRGAFNRERLFREGIRRRRPLHVVPDGLGARVAMLVDAGRAASPVAGVRRGVRASPSGARRLRGYAVAVLIAGLVGLVGLVGVRNLSDVMVASAEAASFPGMAVDVHKRHQRGQLPLELTTDVAGDISRWFEGKVPFVVTLPDYQETSGQEDRYEIRGARLVGFNGDYAAYVAYRMDRQPISLVITSTSAARPAGGDTISARGIAFHFEAIDGLKVITWSHRNLTYALVSNLKERGQRSCMVCHQDAGDEDFIDTLSIADGAPSTVAANRRPFH
ncbi:MAG: zf-HC2 domain-containing protein [Chromatiales bacterium]|nr:zf-HC2 domain-containing protein [Chromatiales bacterium]